MSYRFLSGWPDDKASLSASQPLSIDTSNVISLSANPTFTNVSATNISIGGAPNTYANLAIRGTVNSNALGPHILASLTGDSAPLFNIVPYAHNNISICFDAYFDNSNWKSGSVSSNVQLQKLATTFDINWHSGMGATVGAIPWKTALRVTTNTGDISVLTTTDSSTLATGAFQVKGGMAVTKNANVGGDVAVTGQVTAKKFQSTGITTPIAVTTTYQTLMTFTEDQCGILTMLNTAQGLTWGIWMVHYGIGGTMNCTVISGNNMTLAFSGNLLQVKTGANTHSFVWTYTRLV